jgi:hypothetical protein
LNRNHPIIPDQKGILRLPRHHQQTPHRGSQLREKGLPNLAKESLLALDHTPAVGGLASAMGWLIVDDCANQLRSVDSEPG